MPDVTLLLTGNAQHTPQANQGVEMVDIQHATTVAFCARSSPSQVRITEDLFRMCADLYNAHLEAWVAHQEWRTGGACPPVNSMGEREMRIWQSTSDNFNKWVKADDRLGLGVINQKERAVRRYRGGGEMPTFIEPEQWEVVEIADPDWEVFRHFSETGQWWQISLKGVPTLRFMDKRKRMLRAVSRDLPLYGIRLARGEKVPFEVLVTAAWASIQTGQPKDSTRPAARGAKSIRPASNRGKVGQRRYSLPAAASMR